MAEFVRDVVIAASPETIYGFLTESEKHVLWEGTEAELDARPGGVYDVLIAGEYQARGQYLEVVPHTKVVYSFGWDMPDNPIRPGSTTVEWTLEPEGDKTRVRVRHYDLPEDAVELHAHGWNHYVDRLVVAGCGGDPGPDLGAG
ncbi:MAG: SRPBCC family protein [Acidimicrobiales bacterium]